MISQRQLKYFSSLTGINDLETLYNEGFINEKAVRNKLIREEYYKLLQAMKSGEAIEKLANDYQISISLVEKIASNRL